MNMKKLTLGISLLASAVLFMGCPKKVPNVPPVADTETQSAVDASWATYVITDIDQICAFMGEDRLLEHFYTPIPGTSTIQPIRDEASKTLIMAFNKTRCIDGRLR